MNHSSPSLRHSFQVAPDHPALDGHFPGHPVVPGVVLLDQVMAVFSRTWGVAPPVQFGRVKFMGPVAPGLVMDLQAELATVQEAHGEISRKAKITFMLAHQGRPLVSGLAFYGIS
jgi:3-hydroxyacyl-[acyl-carrier-protein] dehydratase